MVPVNHFKDITVAHNSMLHQITCDQAYPVDRLDTYHCSDNTGRLLAIILRDLLDNPKSKYKKLGSTGCHPPIQNHLWQR